MATEKVTALIPGVGPQVIDIEVSPSEGDDDIARRLSRTFPPGTILGVSGAKWQVTGPGEATELLPPREGPQPGEVWKPKDPRRKASGFRIRAVTETHVEADDGRVVSLDRMKRYEKIG